MITAGTNFLMGYSTETRVSPSGNILMETLAVIEAEVEQTMHLVPP